MGGRTKAKGETPPEQAAPAQPRARAPRALPIRSSPVGTAPSLRAKLDALKPAKAVAAASARIKAKSKPPFARNPVLQELEPRLLMSADLNPALQDTVLATPALAGAEFRNIADTGTPTVVTSAAVAPIQRTNELVFVDTATPDYQKLIDSMRESALAEGRDLQFVLIDAHQDGIRKITDTLAQKAELDAIHVMSHAEDGAVRLGNATLDFDSLLKRAVSIKSWGNALTDTGDILFYGCDLAASANGQSLVDAIARLTGADVAASEDLTGAAAKGGDWDLEFIIGQIEAQAAASETGQASWDWLLVPPVVDLNGPATFTASDTFDASTYTGGTGWTEGWVEFDASQTRFIGTSSSNSDNSPNTGNVVYGNLAGGGNEIAFVGHNNQYGDWIQRSVDLLSYTSATLSFRYALQGIESSSDAISVQVSKDGGATFTTLATYTANGSASPSFNISSYISNKTVIRFAVTGGFDSGGGGPTGGADDRFFLDDVQITVSGNNYETSFTEGGPAVAIAGPNTTVSDPDGSQITSAVITLTNPQAGDVLSWAALPSPITAFLSGNTVTLSGTASGATYANALRQVAFSNTSDAPNTTIRTLTVRVTDFTGEQSTTVTSFVRVVPVDDPLVAAPDAFATYTGTPVSGNVLANNGSGPDTDPDGALGVDTTLVTSPVNGAVTMNADGTFTYTPNPAFNGTDTFQYRLVSEAQVPGAYYEYWDDRPSGNSLLSNFPTGAPTATGYTTSFDVDQIAIAAGNAALTDFTIRFTTSIEILNSGTYTFWTGSDDGSVLRVTSPAGATTLVVDNDGAHSWRERSGTIALTPGRYTIQVEFFEVGTGQEDLNVFYSGADTFDGTVNVKTDLGAVAGRLAPTYATGTATITVAANNAPVASGSATLAAVLEDTASPAGAQVSALFAANYSDAADGMLASPLSGVAIIANAATAAQGTWQYASVAAGPWSDVPTAGLADTAALVLPTSYYLRFLPAANYNGTPGGLSVRLADASAGAIAFSASANISAAIGGTGNWSALSIAAGTNVTAVNDAPTLATGSTLNYTENGAAAAINTAITTADLDNATLASGTVSITTNFASGQDVLAFVNVPATMGNIAGAYSALTGVMTLTSAGSTATLTQWQAALRAVTYANSSDAPSTAARTVSYVVNDGTANSNTVTSTINITAVNDAPSATNLSAAETYTEDTAFNLTDIVVSDVDSTNVTVTLTLSNPAAGSLNTGTSGAVTSTYVAGTGVWTASGAIANVNTLLAGLTFTPATNFNSNFTIATSVSDGAAPAVTGSKAMTGVAVNDAPVNTVPVSITVTEDVASAITGVSIADVDAGAGNMLVTLALPSGTLAAVTGGGVTVGGSGSGTLTLTGSVANINAFIAASNVTFTTALNATAPVTLTVTTDDQGNSPAPALNDVDTVTLNVTAVNDAPTGTDATVATAEDTAYTFTLADFGFADPSDVPANALLAVRIASLPLVGSLTNNAVALNVGDFVSAADIALGRLVFTPVADANGAGYASFTFQVQDNGGTALGGVDLDASPNTMTVNVTAVNDAPTASAPAAYAATEQVSLNLANTGLVVGDVDAGVASVTVTLSVVSGTLTATAGGTGAGIAGSGTGTLTLTGTVAQINNLLLGAGGSTLTYVINTNTPPATDTLTLAINDAGNTGAGGALNASANSTINITAVNDAPVNTVPVSITVTEDVASAITGVSIADVDAGAGNMLVTLALPSGTLAAVTGGGVTVGGSGSGTLTLTGSVANINAFIAASNVTFTTALNATAPVTLTVTTDDQGNSPAPALNDVDTVTLNVTAVNDAPTAVAPAAYAATEQVSLNLANTGLAVGDVDALGANETVTLSVLTGVLNATAGATGVVVAGAGTNTLTLAGTIAQLNNLLAGNLGATLDYFDASDAPPATDTLTLAIDDGGNTGTGGARNAAVNSTINIAAVNDAPANAVPGPQVVNEDTPLTFSVAGGNTIAVADPDAAGLRVTLTVTNGTLTLASLAGLTFTTGDGAADSAMTFTGTAAAINLALDGLSFLPDPNYNGAATVSITTEDLGQSGAGGTLQDTDVIAITVNSVDDAPVIVNRAFAVTEGGSVAIGSPELSATDVDDVATSLVFTIGAVTNGHFERVAAPGVAITTFTQQEVMNGDIRFVHAGSGTAPAATVYVSDGATGVGPYALTITFIAGGAPVVTPLPTGGGSGGGSASTPIEPPLPLPVMPTQTTNSGGRSADAALRAPTTPPADGGDDGQQVEIAAPIAAVSTASAKAEQAIAAEMVLPTGRIESEAIDTKPLSSESDVEPIRAEMQVIPARHNLELDEEERARIEVVLNSVRITGLAFSVGAVWWAARAAGLIASLLASSPAWRHVDPLPVLGRDEEDEDEYDVAEEDKDRKDEEHRAAWVLEER